MAQGATWDVDEFDVNEKKLRQQEIQTFEKTFATKGEGETRGIMGVMLINAPYDVVWEVISDWEAQGEFVPGLEYFKVKHVFSGATDEEWRSLVEGQLDIPFVSFRYTLDARFDKDAGTMRWTMLDKEDIKDYKARDIDVRESDEDSLKNIEGFGRIKSYNDIQTVYYYAPVVEVSAPIPGFVEDIISRISLSRYLEAIRDKAEKDHRRARVESPKQVADTQGATIE
ncbi:MAG: SRPBCC family protein [Ketobacteraceae bacterium]|nr:SRPBCC family protein [Ketobacteraceae bacterium]